MKRYLFKSKKLFIINIFFVTIDSSLYTFLAFLIKDLIDASISKNIEKFTHIALISILFIIVLLTSGYLREIFFGKYIKYNVTNLKNDVFSKIINRSKKNFHSQNTANYISIINNDIELLQRGYFLNFLNIIQAILSFCVACIGLFNLNVIIATFILLLSIIPVIIPYIFNKKMSNLKKTYSDNLSFFMKSTKDFLLGFDIIKSFNLKNKILYKYKTYNNNVEKSRYNFIKFTALINLIIDSFSYSSYFIALGLGTYLVIKNKTTVGTFVASIQLMEFISAPVRSIAYIIASFKSTSLIGKKIIKIIDEDTPTNSGIEKNSFNNSIEFKNISFSYDNQNNILKNISFSINKKQKIALVGKSGCGKSTLIKLLLKYYNDYEGNIFIDNLNTKKIKTSCLYDLISVIHQDIFMFDTNIKNNITLFENYSDEHINKILNNCGLKHFIKNSKNNIDSKIGENGCIISGGEKQRIAIARALIRNTPILILDEATNSLDNKTSYDIENFLLNLKDLTLIVITHNLSKQSLQHYDKIIVLKDGEIVETGSFDELIDNKRYFYNLYSLKGLDTYTHIQKNLI